MKRRPISLALRLTVSIGAVIVVVLLVFGWIVERSIDQHFVQQDVDELAAVVQAVAQILVEPQTNNEQLKRRLASAVSGHHNAQFHLTKTSGEVIYATPGSDLSGFLQTSRVSDALDIHSVSNWQDQGHHYRGAVLMLPGGVAVSGQPLLLVVATDIDFHLHYLEDFRIYLKLITLVACLIAIFATWFAVYQGHAPLRRISGEIRRIKSDHLSIRLAPATVPVELTELAVSFNDMLDRIEEGFQRLSNFSADIAHELRSPITNLRTQTEVALSQTRDVAQYREILYSNLEEYERMAKMVGDMLFLAQAEKQQLQGEYGQVNLAEEVQVLFEYFEAWAEERAVTLDCTGPAVWVYGNRLMLRRALSNLLANAMRYTAEGERVSVTLELHGSDRVLIQVANPSAEIAPEHLPKLFDRFYRADPSRQHKGVGAGLGLAIVKSIVMAHGGRVSANYIDQQIVFRIELPRAFDSVG